jgi:hypothetical protein
MILSKKRYFIYPFYLLAAVFMFTAISGCTKKKDQDTGNPYYMRFKANGKQIEYRPGAQAAFIHQDNLYSCVLSGFVTNSNLSVSLFDFSPITTNVTYTEKILTGASMVVFNTLIGYQDDQGILYNSVNSTAHPNANARVTISEITNGYVKGVFTAVVCKDQLTIKITDGEFYLKRVN